MSLTAIDPAVGPPNAGPSTSVHSGFNDNQNDDASLCLAIALQLEDFERNLGDDAESHAIVEEYKKYLKDQNQILEDRQFAEVLNKENEEELGEWARKAGEDDFEFACRLSLLSYEEELGSIGPLQPDSRPQSQEGMCTGCTGLYPRPKLITPPCKHPYCVGCLKQFFINATNDEQAFPPRCCKVEIPIFLVRRYMSIDELNRFREKTEEYTSRHRLYCASPTCSAFISLHPSSRVNSSKGDNIAICKVCKLGTCLLCKGVEHAGTDCPEDADLTLVLTKAAEMGWQRCHTCLSIVERAFGCQHMSCRCGAEWCYSCAKKWKTCQCGDWEPEGGPVTPRKVEQLRIGKRAGGEAEEEALRKRLREERVRQDEMKKRGCRHGIDPDSSIHAKLKREGKAKESEWWEESDGDEGAGLWRYKAGAGRCEVCQNFMKDYVWMCAECGMEACRWCRTE